MFAESGPSTPSLHRPTQSRGAQEPPRLAPLASVVDPACCIAGHRVQVAGGAAAGAAARLDAAAGDDPSAEQRATAPSVRAEGQHGRAVDRASPRRRRVRRRAEGLARGAWSFLRTALVADPAEKLF